MIRRARIFGFWAGAIALTVTLAACSGEPDTPAPTAVAQLMKPSLLATATSPPTFTPTTAPTSAATRTLSPTFTPTVTATPTRMPTPTPNPLAGYTIEGLRSQEYSGGTIHVRWIITTTNAYTRYYIDYPSYDPATNSVANAAQPLTITGVMQVPHGEGPFPVIILNHGYIPPSRYWSGADTWRTADYLARRGYLTIAPDFRGWGQSDSGDNFFRTGLVIDILNLISSLPSLPQADPERVGMWGHSMGGGATTKAITINSRIKAAVLYAPVSADDTVVLRRWGRFTGGGSADDPLRRAYREAVRNRDFVRLTSPINYFDFVTAPVQIHQGTADTTTPPKWSEAIRDGLQAAGKEVEYFSYPGQGHAFQGESWSLFMQRVVAFFDRYLK